MGSALSLSAIYLYTKLDLNANSSFKVICQTRYCDGQTDGQSDDYMLHSLGHIIMYYNFYHNDYISVPLSILAKVTRTRMTDVTVELINTIHLQFQLSAKIKSFSATEIHVL